MLKSRGFLSAATLVSLMTWGSIPGAADGTPHASATRCADRFEEVPGFELSGALDGNRIRLLNWNIQKSSQPGWRSDLRRFASQTDLLLLQEATLEENLHRAMDTHYHPLFAPGYRSGDSQSGVMTLSRVPALSHCTLSHQEPWLGTPKATGVSRFPLAGMEETLLVVNLHGVNFAFTSESLAGQLRDAGKLIAQHRGPVIFSGDFNTWSDERTLMLNEVMAGIELVALYFPEDHRVQVFGLPLDHIFVRGLRVVDSSSDSVISSDHNPIFATLALEG
jgi:endonuclease/exonuclease/phosphatase (EEP) superfamily protein YafD